ncbi:MAG: hypothetical protein JWR67_1804 [Mucilaginibacter sp.]|nr:hypothetical protein [Mucilaginibacter sp.]
MGHKVSMGIDYSYLNDIAPEKDLISLPASKITMMIWSIAIQIARQKLN